MRQIRQDITIEQQQKLYMTTELRQAISVLQMSSLDLNEFITKNVEENLFLDDEEESSDWNFDEALPKNPRRITLEDLIDNQQEYSGNYGANDHPENNTVEKYLSNTQSLYDHLVFQLNMELREPVDILIGQYIIGCIDSNGYLTVSLQDIAHTLNIRTSKAEEILAVIQSFTPAGVGARNLQECLLLQLKQHGIDSTLIKKIMMHHFKDLADKKFFKIAQVLKIDVKAIQEIYDLIRTLDPKPGLQYGDSRNSFVWPDVTLVKDGDKYQIIVNDQDFSYLRINRLYLELIKQPNCLTGEVRRYLEEKLESALGLIRGIEQRRINIYKVVQCIVDIQGEFLEKGIEFLKPLTMNRVAEMLNIHESTVSRVTSNKYIQTPRGLFPLKYFFSSSVTSQYSDDLVCSKSVKHLIQEIVNNEDPREPLSDQEITQALVKKGINISRRTVNKYRQSMGIPTNSLRKRYE